MSEGHAKLSPSAAERWMTCPGSVALASTVVDAGSSDADQGTACHRIVEECLKQGKFPDHYRGVELLVTNDEAGTSSKVLVTEEMVGWCEEVLSWVKEYLVAHPGARVYSEERCNAGAVFSCPDDLWGTSDVVIVDAKGEELVIADAKFGMHAVHAKGNKQLTLYALGVMHDFGWVFDRVRLVILQPRAHGVDEWVYTAEELDTFRLKFAPKVKEALDPLAPLVPSTLGCRWCPAAGICPALQEQTLVTARREFAEPHQLTLEQLVTLVREKDRIVSALNAAERHAVKLLQSGVKLPGFKLVEADTRAKWTDEDAALAVLVKAGYPRDELAPPQLRSYAQVRDLVALKKYTTANAAQKKSMTKEQAKNVAVNALASLISKPKGEATIAPEADPRPALAGEFEELPGSGDVRGLL